MAYKGHDVFECVISISILNWIIYQWRWCKWPACRIYKNIIFISTQMMLSNNWYYDFLSHVLCSRIQFDQQVLCSFCCSNITSRRSPVKSGHFLPNWMTLSKDKSVLLIQGQEQTRTIATAKVLHPFYCSLLLLASVQIALLLLFVPCRQQCWLKYRLLCCYFLVFDCTRTIPWFLRTATLNYIFMSHQFITHNNNCCFIAFSLSF